jgi:hypothetical protein
MPKEADMGSRTKMMREMISGLKMTGTERDLLRLSNRNDDYIFRTIGVAASKMGSELKPDTSYLESPNINDTEGKSPYFFRQPTIPSRHAGMYGELPSDPLEAGRMVFDRLHGKLSRVVCETVNRSPLSGYKQEEVRLGATCVDAISAEWDGLDKKLIEGYVAVMMKQHFSDCAMW